MKRIPKLLHRAVPAVVAGLLLHCLPALAATPDFVGHWEGEIAIPNQPLAFDIDLSTANDGTLTGDISVPVQQTSDQPILELRVDDGDHIILVLTKELGEPTFDGTRAGEEISGTFTQGQASLDFEMKRTSPQPQDATAVPGNQADQAEESRDDHDSAQTGAKNYQIEAMPEDLEIRFALSALPVHLRKEASVYVLDPQKGYRKVRSGTNGFHALVMRSVPEAVRADWPFTHYPDDVYAPVAFDSAGVDAHMQPILDLEQMRATGVPPQEAERLITKRFADGTYKAPGRTGIAYMLSPVLSHNVPDGRGRYVDNVSLAVFPHYMIYAPNVTDADIGGIPGQHMFTTNPGIHAFIIHPASKEETTQILKQNERLLADLCAYKQSLCIDQPK